MSSVADLAEDLGAQLADAVAEALREFEPVDVLDDVELARRLTQLERLRRQLEHAIVGVVAGADRRGVWAADGHRSVRGWCQASVNWSGGETTRRIRSAPLLADLGSVADALAAGSIGVAQVGELARARANPRCGDELVDCEATMPQFAQYLPYDEFRLVVQRWEALADADGAHRTHEQTHAGRNASIEPLGNGYRIDGECDVAQGVRRQILDKFCDAEFHADRDEARARLGDDVTPSELARTAGQRRMDALHAIFLAAAATPPGGKAPEPVVNIVVDQATFEAAMTAMATGVTLAGHMPPVSDPARRRCETTHGDLVDPCDVVTAAAIGHVRRVVFNSASCTIDLGTASRLFRGASRLAVWLLGTRCLWPGCGRRRCQIDHSRPWSELGPTDPDNAGPVCGHHNRWKTRGYHTWRDPNGHWHVYRPDGSEIRPI